MPPAAVLDTQAVLDWLYFGDPLTRDWLDHLQAGRWQWWACPPLRDELAHVLGRGHLPAPRGLAAQALLETYDRLVQMRPAATALAHGPLRCSDRDDQKFIDFAVAEKARWLVSRDRAVLKLRRRAATLHGLQIVSPADWRPGEAAAG